jgi:hypothetical protein
MNTFPHSADSRLQDRISMLIPVANPCLIHSCLTVQVKQFAQSQTLHFTLLFDN